MLDSKFWDQVSVRILTERASDFFTRIIARLNSGGYPQGDSGRAINPTTSIQEALSISSIRKNGDTYFIDILGDFKKAPFIWAFEYGSGKQGDKGSTYPIYPQTSSLLAFYWDKFPAGPGAKFAGYGKKDGKHLFFYVDHPGIKAKPFIRPTVDEHVKNFQSSMIEKYKLQIRAGILGSAKEVNIKVEV